jgi:cytochrome c biogenesis protein ResB
VLKKTIAVNDSLSYRGYRFYQSGYDEKNEQYTTLSVVKDPGLETAYAGFAMLTVGIIYMLYVRPRLVKSRRGRRQEGLAE